MKDKKILITGFSGFVAWHFVEYLCEKEISIEIYGIDVREPSFDFHKYNARFPISFKKVDMTDVAQLHELFEEFIPDYILHLAAYSSVAYSWKKPAESFINNNVIFLNLVEEIRKFNPACRILSVGSSEEYGEVVEEDLPINEGHKLNPTSPYAVARVAQEMMSRLYVDTLGLDIVMTRSFNHIGPGQDDRFVVPSFINQILDLKRNGLDCGIIETGDVTKIRDFVDVRDVVRAYYLLLKNGKTGEIYNVCAGNGIALYQLLELISNIIGIKIEAKMVDAYIRPKDNKIVIGSAEKMRTEIGWVPKIELVTTIRDMIDFLEKVKA